MASTDPLLPEQFRAAPAEEFLVSELASQQAGSLSPYGADIEFPLPLERLRYVHPGPADRPNLAGGR